MKTKSTPVRVPVSRRKPAAPVAAGTMPSNQSVCPVRPTAPAPRPTPVTRVNMPRLPVRAPLRQIAPVNTVPIFKKTMASAPVVRRSPAAVDPCDPCAHCK